MIKKILSSLTVLFCLSTALQAQSSDVQVVHDAQGWKLQVDGSDFNVKGVVWSYTPIGENFTYDLWSQPDSVIRHTIDTDMTLMKNMGVNTIRVFSVVPPRWIEYIYNQYGIYTMVNDLFGRYGVTVDGRWQFPTNYADPDTRKYLLAEAKKTFETYKDTPGVLLYMLGNESNYGLDWSSAATENLPSGEANTIKAKALYSLMGQALAMGKKIDPHHPMGLVNGDLGYLNLIRDLVPDLDILGVNTYRGPKSYAGFYNSIAKILNKPFVYTELGADAYNVATNQEDQKDQAELIASQWKEIYQEAYGKGEAANCLGGYVFEWMDEWWKNGMTTGLSTHDTEGTWTNGAYAFDAIPGKNNMNEEWFGLCSLSQKTEQGIPVRLPRMSYYLLKQLWTLDLYTSNKQDIDQAFQNLQVQDGNFQAKALALEFYDGTTNPHPVFEVHGSIESRTYLKGDDHAWSQNGLTGLTAQDQTTTKLGVTFNPSEGVSGSVVVRLLPNQVSNNPIYDIPDPIESAALLSGNTTYVVQPIELYQATLNYKSTLLDATFHYHDGHADWGNQGDFFGLLPETFDLFHMDKGGSKAPLGLEFHSPTVLPDLTIYAGPEIYWGANPSIFLKYTYNIPQGSLTLIHDEEVSPYLGPEELPTIGVSGGAPAQTDAQKHADRWTSLDFNYNFPHLFTLETGALMARYDRVASSQFTYTTVSGNTITTGKEFSLADSFAGKIRFTTTDLPYVQAMVQYIYAGLLADTHAAVSHDGSQLYDSGSGNRSEFKVSLTGIYGDFSLTGTGLYRVPLVGPLNQTSLGVTPRNPLVDSFTVWDNREALQAEALFTWNPSGATYFYDWNNPDREAAPLAASLGLLYNFHLGPTDASSFLAADNYHIYAFTAGLPAVDNTYSFLARVTGRPAPGLRINLTGQVADQQATGVNSSNVAPVVQFWKTGAQVAWDRLYFEGNYASNAWGPFDWMRQFGINYPTQWMVGVAYGLKPISFLTDSDRIGLRFYERSYGSSTPATEQVLNGVTLNDRFVAELYAGWSF